MPKRDGYAERAKPKSREARPPLEVELPERRFEPEVPDVFKPRQKVKIKPKLKTPAARKAYEKVRFYTSRNAI